jgi:hypothetical protein
MAATLHIESCVLTPKYGVSAGGSGYLHVLVDGRWRLALHIDGNLADAVAREQVSHLAEACGLKEDARLAAIETASAVVTQALHTTCETFGDLYDYLTGTCIRPATQEESQASEMAAESDGGAGVILVDGRSCYVA